MEHTHTHARTHTRAAASSVAAVSGKKGETDGSAGSPPSIVPRLAWECGDLHDGGHRLAHYCAVLRLCVCVCVFVFLSVQFCSKDAYPYDIMKRFVLLSCFDCSWA